MKFDGALTAMAGCPVIPGEQGSMLFNPYPIIFAPNDLILAHEITHVLAGRNDYAVFNTAIKARGDDEAYKIILNFLLDWYHESLYGNTSAYLEARINILKSGRSIPKKVAKETAIHKLYELYLYGTIPKDMPKVKSILDLVIYADSLWEEISAEKKTLEVLMKMGDDGNIGAGGDLGRPPKRCSTYYQNAVAKYYKLIESLSDLWKRNRYAWIDSYYGEINWKDLVRTFLGDKLTLPVFRLFSKISFSKSVYLVIDRSGSTASIKDVLMDTAIIITESLRMLGTPISILDVGPQNRIVNELDEDLDLDWFVPTSDNGTPLGEVCSQIRNPGPDDYILIITDGAPNDWDLLASFLQAFPGYHLTFVIGGDSFDQYYQKTQGHAILVDPNTIIREMLYETSLA